jgi:RecA/RadA recombinase
LSKLLKDLIKASDNDYAQTAAEGVIAGDIVDFIDTGSYAFNALLSGSIYGGLPSNKVTMLAGEESTGKTFYALSIAKSFLGKNDRAIVVCFETESAMSKQMLIHRGIDVDRFAVVPVSTVEEFRTQALRILNEYLEKDEADRDPMLFILDSLGGLSTNKEVTDMEKGEDKRDMTRAQLIRGTFRVLTLKAGRANVAILLTNHVYVVVGAYIPTKETGGGAGAKYAASQIIYLSKKKGKDGDDVVGSIVTCKTEKSRLTIEGKKVETLLRFDTGLDKYFGLLSIAEASGLVKRVGNKYEFSKGAKAFESEIKRNPEVYFTPDILDEIDKACEAEFKFGTTNFIETDGKVKETEAAD